MRDGVLGQVALLLLVVACTPSERQRPSILLAVLDTVRADSVSAYGQVAGTTPELDRLAAEGVLYERVWAQAPWTLPSHATLLSGLPPERHGVSARQPRVPTGVVLLAEMLRSAGYETAAVSENPWIHHQTRLSRGFDWFRFVGTESLPDGRRRIRLDRSVALVSEWLDSRSQERPFFLFLNVVDAHSPYLVRRQNRFLAPDVEPVEASQILARRPEPTICSDWRPDSREGAIRRGLYLGGVSAADAKLGAVLRALRAGSTEVPLIAIVTSDHGEHLGEHGLTDHFYSLYEELLRVPLVVHGLGGPIRIRETVALMDVVPSVLAWLHLPQPDALPGRPLPLQATPDSPHRSFTAAFRDPLGRLADPGDALTRTIDEHARLLRTPCADRAPRGDLRAAIRYPLKLIEGEGSEPRLFDIERDAGESRDLAAEYPRIARGLRALLRSAEDEAPGDPPPRQPADREALEGLRALGYLHGED